MNVLVLSMLVACASAQYYYGYSGYPYYAPYAAYTASQYHSQDEYGQASYGYSHPGQASTTYRDAFGNQIGSYAYINAEGKEVRVSYVADANGFRVLSNDLPQAPTSDLVGPVFDGQGPEPVQDTAEVAAAKAEFFKLYKEAADAAAAVPEDAPATDAPATEAPATEAPAAESRKKRSALTYSLPLAAPVASPVLAKTTIKTTYFEKDEAAKTPASTTKVDLKEKEQEIVSPVAYSVPLIGAVAAPVAAVAAPAVVAPATIIPAVAKTTIKTAYFEKDEAAKTPASTTKIDLKEKEQEVLTPVAYPYPYVAAAPVAAKLVAAPYYGYHVVA